MHVLPTCSEDKYILYADGKVCTSMYCDEQSDTDTYFLQVQRTRAYLDSLSMDSAEVAVNCLCSVRSCSTCWCPELANAHRGECEYRRMTAVMEELDAEWDRLLDEDDKLVGRVKDVKEVEKRLRRRLPTRNAWRLIPYFELFMSSPKDELHQWYVHLSQV
jgi:hypothetical protein